MLLTLNCKPCSSSCLTQIGDLGVARFMPPLHSQLQRQQRCVSRQQSIQTNQHTLQHQHQQRCRRQQGRQPESQQQACCGPSCVDAWQWLDERQPPPSPCWPYPSDHATDLSSTARTTANGCGGSDSSCDSHSSNSCSSSSSDGAAVKRSRGAASGSTATDSNESGVVGGATTTDRAGGAKNVSMRGGVLQSSCGCTLSRHSSTCLHSSGSLGLDLPQDDTHPHTWHCPSPARMYTNQVREK